MSSPAATLPTPPAPTRPPPPRRAARGPLGRVIDVLGSFGLACVILMLLFVVVLVGTIAQKSQSLYDVQRIYFESTFFVVRLFGVLPVPLPGGALLLTLLLANLLVGGILRMRLGRSTLGILITHLGIVTLLVGSAIEYARSDKGYVMLHLGESGGVFRSYTDWEVAVREDAGPGAKEYVIAQQDLAWAQDGRRTIREHPDLPFAIELEGYLRNADVARDAGATATEGFLLQAVPIGKEAEANVPGVYVTLVPRTQDAPVRGILYGFQRAPLVVRVAGKRYEVHLRKREWPLPYVVRLDRFVKKEHPGTSMAKEYSSYVTKLDDGVAEKHHITMNEPLRSRGYTFYQSSYGPADPRSREPVYSVFSVVRNPTDRVPLIACIVIAAGLILHFGQKLLKFLRRRAPPRRTEALA